MKNIYNIYGFISFKHIILLMLLAYIIWLVNIFRLTIIGIDKMYTDSYDKIADENIKIADIIRIKNKNDFEEYKVSIDTIIGN